MVPFSAPTAGAYQGRLKVARIDNPKGDASTLPEPHEADPRIGRVMALMHATPQSRLPLCALAGAAGLSVSRLCHLFQAEIGISPGRYLKAARLAKAKDLLETSSLSVKEVAAQAGFNHVGRFIGEFRSTYGFTPYQYYRLAIASRLSADSAISLTQVR